MQRIGILGGTFNPVHIGHIRPAVEVFEALQPDRIDLIPCASPPHKAESNLLPFELRAKMLAAAAAPFPYLQISHIENERPGPSYTYDTLTAYHASNPGCSLFFILGAGDLVTLPDWHKGMQIPNLADLVVLPRSGRDVETVHSVIRDSWPDAVKEQEKAPLAAVYRLPSGHKIHFLPQPRLDISATLVRERWLAGRNVTYLVPRAVLDIMLEHRETITACWSRG
ncbi:nicotinate (nicotinamide) nucleotide adenylyltransferase [Desulfovibrio mangrovi]|uniref:nicotinate (nicotinamide) nucleotide adenylyltransferase n=1 Tax=Desulfovibrio mangrovi TaxID=2976983 RepID=UPI0022451B4B|nr:nicotinate (nicotinamide) nucleotide adenylyltransferase [Desulfovibrio mangrovi]UZP68053.1 nicotinate (nicotinamide) nucleotide adenylyltransferase [Desulfovibrio mangrovi]